MFIYRNHNFYDRNRVFYSDTYSCMFFRLHDNPRCKHNGPKCILRLDCNIDNYRLPMQKKIIPKDN